MENTHISDRVDVDIVFSILGMGHKRLDQELSEVANNVLDLLLLARSLLNPGSCFGPGLVESQETTLASSLDQLIWLCDKLGAWSLQPWVCGFGLVEDSGDLLIFREIE
jgi:hypothetical protein